MTGTNATTHWIDNVVSAGNTYNRYFQCTDATGNNNSVDTHLQFSINTTPSGCNLATLNSQMLTYYKDEETTTPYVDAAGNHNLTTGGTLTRVQGIIDYGQQFGFQDKVYTANSADFEISEPTYCAWINHSSFSAINQYIITTRYGATTVGVWLYTHKSDDYPYFYTVTTGGGEFAVVQSALNISQQYFVCGAFVNGNPWIYLNGNNRTDFVSHTGSGTIVYNSGNTKLQVGDSSTTSWLDDNFMGTMDEVMVFNGFIGEDCIDWLYNNSEPTSYQQYPFSEPTPPTSTGIAVLNMTFDDDLQDDGVLAHVFDVQGTVTQTNNSLCKWYGCANFSAGANDYINSTWKVSTMAGMAIGRWLYYTVAPGQTNVQGDYQFGSAATNTQRYTQYATYNYNAHWDAATGEVGSNTADWDGISINRWYYVFEQYNGTHFTTWINGDDYVKNQAMNKGDLNHTLGDYLEVGQWGSGRNMEGYIDEFVVYNRSNFTTTEVEAIYKRTAQGTPPELDLHPCDIRYKMPVNYSNSMNNKTKGGLIQFNMTICNEGTNNSVNFPYNFTMAGVNVCSGTTQINAQSNVSIKCNWTTSVGMIEGHLIADSNNTQPEDDETNNDYEFYVPFMDRPWYSFNQSEWTDILKPYCDIVGENPAYQSCNRYKSFISEDFNEAWDGDDVDPRGKKGRENAMGCMYNGYNMSTTQCGRALNHILGWANRTVSTYDDVQAIHELIEVGMTYDIMFPALTEAQVTKAMSGYYEICQHIINIDGVRPDLDDQDIIAGGNGKGFGSGMGGFCYAILGDYAKNPTIRQEISDNYDARSVVTEWMGRESRYLYAYKNDSNAKYQEGPLYKFYSQFHLVEIFHMQVRLGMRNLEEHGNAMCAMAKEIVTETLDYKYNGDIRRGDEDRNQSIAQRGDSNTYEDIASDSILGPSIITYYGALCDDTEVKQAVLYLRNLTYIRDAREHSIPEMYIYKQLEEQVSPVNPHKIMPRQLMDNANDIFTIRDGYTYESDTILQIDGGEERGSGHSQAQGYYLYAKGEPFVDWEQVPYDDDVRAETWKNGISLQNITQTVAGADGEYSQACGNAPKNQYYGMINCTEATISGDYPDYRRFPLKYGGDIENYMGTSDGVSGGAYVWRPYVNATIREYFVKFGDLISKRSKVSGLGYKGIYHNFLSLNEEFIYSTDSDEVNQSKNGVYMSTKYIYGNTTMTMMGGETTIRANRAKTSSVPLDSNYTRYYLYTADKTADFIHSHAFGTGALTEVTVIGTTDKGTQQGTKFTFFDTNNDGKTVYLTTSVIGWAVAYDSDEVMAYNTTDINISYDLYKSNDTASVHFKLSSSVINMTANTAERRIGIDYPKTVRVTLDTQVLTNTTGQTILKNGVTLISPVSTGTDSVVFDITPELNSDYYEIRAGGTPVGPTGTDSTVVQIMNKLKQWWWDE